MILLLLLSLCEADFTEARVENPALALRLQSPRGLNEQFAVNDQGTVLYSYGSHVNRFRLDADIARCDAEALLYRQIDGKVAVRTTSQAAHGPAGTALKGSFQTFLRVEGWSNVWFSYSTTAYEQASGPRRHLVNLRIDRRGRDANRSWDFEGSFKAASFDRDGQVIAILDVERLRSAVDTYRLERDRYVRVNRQLLPQGMMAIAYDPSTRRCVAEGIDKTVIVHVPSGAIRELPALGTYASFTMTRGRIYCQSGSTLYVDNGNRWEAYSLATLLAASNNGKHWLLYRSGQVILRTYTD